MASIRPITTVSIVAAILIAASTPARADDDDQADDDLSDLEDALAADAAEAAENQPPPQPARAAGGLQSLNPDISFIVDLALAGFSADDNLQAGGHDPTANGFNLQGVEMAVSKAVDPYFRVDGNIVFTGEGVEVEEFYATTLALPHSLQARIGQFLTRFGRHNPTHPHTWDFVDAPFALARYLGGDGSRGLGAELSYLTPLPWYVEIVGSINNSTGETAPNFLGEDENATIDSPLDFMSTLAIKQFFELSDNWSLMVGTSAVTGPNPSADDARTNIFGADLYMKYRPVDRQSYTVVELEAEWLYRRRDIPDDLIWDHGGYVQGVWKMTKRWGTAARYEYGQRARGAGGDGMGDDLDPAWTADRHRASASLTFWPTEFSRVRAQASVDLPGWLDDPIVAGFLAFEFSIGAHGAHAF